LVSAFAAADDGGLFAAVGAEAGGVVFAAEAVGDGAGATGVGVAECAGAGAGLAGGAAL